MLTLSPMVPGVALVPRDAKAGQYVPLESYEKLLREYEQLKEMYDNLLYASQRLVAGPRERRTRDEGDRESADVSELRTEVQ